MYLSIEKKEKVLKVLLFSFLCFLIASSFKVNNSIQPFQCSIDTANFNNEYVIVYKNRSLLNNNTDHQIEKRIIVALSDVLTVTNGKNIQLKRGSILVFKESETYHILSGEYFEIGVKKSHPKPEPPKIWYEPTQNNIVYDDNDFRVFEERLAPHHDRDLHSHLQRLVVRLNTVHLTDPRYYPNGQEGKGIQESNTIKFAEPIEHVVRNLSDIPLFNIVIEFKHSQV